MASRAGVRADGTDGSDFAHREKIQPIYRLSSEYKSKLKIRIFFHVLMFLLMFAKCSARLLRSMGVQLGELVNTIFPQPLMVEYFYLFGVIFAICLHMGIRRNKEIIIKSSAWGIFVFNVIPISIAGKYYTDDVMNYLTENWDDKIVLLHGIPFVAIWFIFFSIAFVLHMMTIAYSIFLIKTWSRAPMTKKLD